MENETTVFILGHRPRRTLPLFRSVGRSVDCLKSERERLLIMDTAPRTGGRDGRRLPETDTKDEARCNRCSRSSIKKKYRTFTAEAVFTTIAGKRFIAVVRQGSDQEHGGRRGH